MFLILTPGERFWLMSQRMGWTRRQLAEIYSPRDHRPVALSTVDKWFHDKGNVPEVVLGEPFTSGERCAIARRRCSLSVPALSKLSGIEATDIALVERGLISPKPLKRYWYQRGWPPYPYW